jgi:DNA-binding response OmpR family regulator
MSGSRTNSAEARLRHDLRTPINQILGYGDLLLEDVEAGGEDARAIEIERVLAIARGLFARLEAAASDGSSVDALCGQVREPAAQILTEVARLRQPDRPQSDDADLAKIAQSAEALLTIAADWVCPAESGMTGTWATAELSTLGPAAPGTGEPSARLLVVDDDAADRALLGRRLEREGYLVRLAAGGMEALALLESNPIDVILLDVLMPGLSGIEVLRRLKQHPRLAGIPVLMISALDEQKPMVRCIAAGAEDYLPKHLDPMLLRARIGACLRKKRQRDVELAYLRDVAVLTAAAEALQDGRSNGPSIDGIAGREDALGILARVFGGMVREVQKRERRLSAQVALLTIEIDEARKARAVSEIVETDYFQDLQRRAAELRRSSLPH